MSYITLPIENFPDIIGNIQDDIIYVIRQGMSVKRIVLSTRAMKYAEKDKYLFDGLVTNIETLFSFPVVVKEMMELYTIEIITGKTFDEKPYKSREDCLRELEEKSKQEIEKAQKMMKASEYEIQIEEDLKDVEIPEAKQVNVQDLFSDESSLEEAVQQEAAERDINAEPQYDTSLDEAKQLADTLMNSYGVIKELVANQGNLSESDAERLASYSEAAEKLYESGFKPEEQDMQNVVGEADRLLYEAKKQSRGESSLRQEYIK